MELSPQEEEMVARVERKIGEVFEDSQQLDAEAKTRILRAAMQGLVSRPPKSS